MKFYTYGPNPFTAHFLSFEASIAVKLHSFVFCREAVLQLGDEILAVDTELVVGRDQLLALLDRPPPLLLAVRRSNMVVSDDYCYQKRPVQF